MYYSLPVDHKALFLHTRSTSLGGQLLHIVGWDNDLAFENRPAVPPPSSPSHIRGTLKLVGFVEASRVKDFETLCESVEMPKVERDDKVRKYRCGDWVNDVIRLGTEKGLILSRPSDNTITGK